MTKLNLRSAVQRGILLNPRRGLYVDRAVWRTASNDTRLAMRLLAVQLVAPDAIGVDLTAATIWRLPVRRTPETPQVARQNRFGALAGGRVLRTVSQPRAMECVDGLSVTTLPDTVIGIAARYPRADALITLDAALRRGLSRDELMTSIERLPYSNAQARALDTLDLGDPWSESWLESLSRGRGIDLGMPVPLCNVTLVFANFEARVDELWVELGVIGECDGKGKYLKRVGDVAQVHWDEKQRHEDLEENGFAVARWGTKQVVGDGAAMLRRFHRAVSRQQSSATGWPDGVRAELRRLPGVDPPPRVTSEVQRLQQLGYPISFADQDWWRPPESINPLWTPDTRSPSPQLKS